MGGRTFRYAQSMGSTLVSGLLVLSLVGGFTAPHPAPSLLLAQQRRDGIWTGSGQIINGPGSGGTVNLTVQVEGNHYRSLEGPRLNVYADGPTFNDQGNQWQFQFSGRLLNVTLTRRNGQVINFTLTPG